MSLFDQAEVWTTRDKLLTLRAKAHERLAVVASK